MLAALKGLFKKRKHNWTRAGYFGPSSTAYPGDYFVTLTCRECWWSMFFVLSPHIHNELKHATCDEFIEGIKAHIISGASIPFYADYRDTNPWEPYYKDTRRNPLYSTRRAARLHLVWRYALLLPEQLSELGKKKRCRPWAMK